MKIIQAHNYFEDEKPLEALYVNSCGYFYDIDYDTETNRPDGREDYQLIYITDGSMNVEKDDGIKVYPKGTILLFRPGVPQIYHCRRDSDSEYMWIHFSGYEAENILKNCGFAGDEYRTTSVHASDIDVIQQMVAEITQKPMGYQVKLVSLFCGLLNKLMRRTADKRDRAVYRRLSPAINAMEQKTHRVYSVAEYAAMCNMSEYHFLHSFKEYSGQSPIQYRNGIAMKRAEYLLENTDLPVGEIARAVGIEDALYFSKKFRQYFGISPTACRKR